MTTLDTYAPDTVGVPGARGHEDRQDSATAAAALLATLLGLAFLPLPRRGFFRGHFFFFFLTGFFIIFLPYIISSPLCQ